MKKNIGISFAVLSFLAMTGIAFAQTTTTPAPNTVSSRMVVQIGPEGRVLLRGTIDAVSTTSSATSITVKSWGGDWTVNVPSTASVLPEGAALSSFKTGDFIGVQGTVDSTANWTVNATLVRDWSARQALRQEIQSNVQAVHDVMASAPLTIQGTLSNLDAAAQTFTLTKLAGTTYAVSLTSGAKLLTRNWATLDFSKVSNGDMVRVYGTIASSTISASIFRDVTVN